MRAPTVDHRCPQCHRLLEHSDWKGQVRYCRACDVTVPTGMRMTMLEEF